MDKTRFQLESKFAPAGDQPQAIDSLVTNYEAGQKQQVLMGVTGSGKTFSAANVIARINKPTLVLSHNKTLAAQLYKEFRGFFPRNAVHYFISYYDYYQPEAYIPQRDIYIEKDAAINENIDRLRLAATSALVSREDVIIVASVSCIYGLGSPMDYKRMMIYLRKGDRIERDELLLKLVDIQYERNDTAFERGRFRVRGDVIEVRPAYEEYGLRVELFGDEVDALAIINPTSGETLRRLEELYIYPAKHFVTPEERIHEAVIGIGNELDQRLGVLRGQGKLLEAQRLSARTRFDMEMLEQVGHCPGIENYARWFSGKAAGEPPYTLLDFFPPDMFVIVDESHVTLPQVRAMFAGDFSRKTTLVEHGFRLPSALDNRPLKFEEWEKRLDRVLFMSATPGPYELDKCGGEVVEQVIRPTGLVDPELHIRPARGQVPDLVAEIRKRAELKERVLVTTLTKRMAEDLTRYLHDAGLRCKWLHSELDAFERVQILTELREGAFDTLVGVNLLREGLDLPEVSLVVILDADKEGFLRSETSLIQTIGRAARNVNAQVILYADRVTDSMQRAISETNRRRDLQLKYNAEHGITPESVRSAISSGIADEIASQKIVLDAAGIEGKDYVTEEYLEELHAEMLAAAANLEFERAAQLRDRIAELKGQPSMAPQVKKEPKKEETYAIACLPIFAPHCISCEGLSMVDNMLLKLGSSSSLIGFETAAGGSWTVWDRYLTLEGRRAYHIGNICNTCTFFFERLEGANRSISPATLADQLAKGPPRLDHESLEHIGSILPTGEYVATLQNVSPRLISPGTPEDYFSSAQVSLWGIDGFWGLPHHPRTEYYLGRTVELAAKARLYEFVIPMFPHAWLKPETVSTYRFRSAINSLPTAISISILDVKGPAVWQGEPEVSAHWCLAHYLLDGHHKVFAASLESRKVGLLSFVALNQGISTLQDVERALDALQSL